MTCHDRHRDRWYCARGTYQPGVCPVPRCIAADKQDSAENADND